MTSPVPQGYHTATPFLIFRRASDAIEFYQQAFGAEEIARMPGPGGKLLYAEIQIGDSRIMLADELPKQQFQSHTSVAETGYMVHLYVEDTDEVFEKAVAAGAKVVLEPRDQYWGDRYARIEDPFGHRWAIATRKEDLTLDEIVSRAPTMGI